MGKVDCGKVAGKTGPADTGSEPGSPGDPVPPEVNAVSRGIIGAAIEVHRHLGPGLLESIYEQALVHELGLRGMAARQQVPVTVHYKGLEIGGQRLDLVVEGRVVVELKTVDQLLPIHEAQLLSYLKSTGMRLGLLINFKSRLLKNGVRRIIN